MKNLLFLLLFLPLAFAARSQAVNKLQADSFRVYQNGGSAEFILENKTRSNTGAFLRNRWDGRTEFAYALDSVWKEGDLLKFTRGQSTLTFNLNALEGSAAKLDSVRIRNDSAFFYKNGGSEYFAGKVGTTVDSFTYATRRYVDSTRASITAITSLNGATNATQTFAFTTAAGTMGWSTDGTTGIHSLRIPYATASDGGLMNTTTQTFAGRKTFNAGIVLPTMNQTYDSTDWKPLVRHYSGVVAQGWWYPTGGGGGGGSGTVNSGTANQLAYYASTGTGVSGASGVTTNGTNLTAAGDLNVGNLLNLANKATAPTGGNGGLFYNSSIDRFQGIQGGAVRNLVMESTSNDLLANSLQIASGSELSFKNTSGVVGFKMTSPTSSEFRFDFLSNMYISAPLGTGSGSSTITTTKTSGANEPGLNITTQYGNNYFVNNGLPQVGKLQGYALGTSNWVSTGYNYTPGGTGYTGALIFDWQSAADQPKGFFYMDDSYRVPFAVNKADASVSITRLKANAIEVPVFTPSSSSDASGNLNDVTRDDNYLYIKTSSGWKRSSLSTF